MEVRKVNRPVFRLAQPGQDVRWSTRDGSKPQIQMIKQRRAQLNPLSGFDGHETGAVLSADESDRMKQAIEAKNRGLQQRALLPENEQDMDLFLEDSLTDPGYDLASPEDIQAYKSGNVSPDLIQRLKNNVDGVVPTFGNDRTGKNWTGDVLNPSAVDAYFKRRGY